ncbi:hypothetical protein KQH26_00285 [bacterium]|nr:hypothetical protein [bacterium]
MKMIQQYISTLVNQINFRYNVSWLYMVLFSIIILLPGGCKKDNLLGEYLLGDLKNQNPFNGAETIIFLDNNNDSIVFYGEGRYSELIESKPDKFREDYYLNELDYCNFIEKNDTYELLIRLGNYYSHSADLVIELTRFVNPDQIRCPCSATFNIPLMDSYIDSASYIDSLSVLNQNYYNVFVDSSIYIGNANNCHDQIAPTAIFYTTTHGIIKIDFKDGSVWELKEIIP